MFVEGFDCTIPPTFEVQNMHAMQCLPDGLKHIEVRMKNLHKQMLMSLESLVSTIPA